MYHLSYLCLVFVMLSRLFIAALWPPAGKGLTSWLMLVTFNCVFVAFPCGILGQVWYLVVSIHDLCRLSYFDVSKIVVSTPRYLDCVSASSVWFFRLQSKRTGDRARVMRRTLHLSGWNSMPHVSSHVASSLKSFCSWRQSWID